VQRLVDGEEDAHVRHDLDDGGGEAAEEARGSLVARDGAQRGREAGVDALRALRREAGPQQVERVGEGCAEGAGGGAGDEGLGGLRELGGEALQEDGGEAVGCEL